MKRPATKTFHFLHAAVRFGKADFWFQIEIFHNEIRRLNVDRSRCNHCVWKIFRFRFQIHLAFTCLSLDLLMRIYQTCAFRLKSVAFVRVCEFGTGKVWNCSDWNCSGLEQRQKDSLVKSSNWWIASVLVTLFEHTEITGWIFQTLAELQRHDLDMGFRHTEF